VDLLGLSRVSFVVLLFNTYKELTDMVYIPKLGFCAFVDTNVSVLVARPTRLLRVRHCDRGR
jgi:hypothetical protein